MIPPCYVITLNGNLGEQGEALKEVGLNPIIFNGVDARKDEHLQYIDYINPTCLDMCPKSVIGCGLSHVLLAQKIYYTGASIAIILEDDAFPIVKHLEDEIHKVINEVPDDWECIKMHCDPHCVDGQNENEKNGSTAAYILNRKGMEIVMNTRVQWHIDWQFNNILKMYKTRTNLFITDERKVSTNRIQSHTFLSYIMDEIRPIKTGEKTWDDLHSYKFFRIPNTSIELTLRHITYIQIFLVLLGIYLLFRFHFI